MAHTLVRVDPILTHPGVGAVTLIVHTVINIYVTVSAREPNRAGAAIVTDQVLRGKTMGVKAGQVPVAMQWERPLDYT